MQTLRNTLFLFILGSCYSCQPNLPTYSDYFSAIGTIYLYPEIITKNDPSALDTIQKSIIESNIKMFDREANNGIGDWIYPDAYIFEVSYLDRLDNHIRIRKKDYSIAEATEIAKEYAYLIGQLPTCLRRNINHINIMKGDREWGGNSTTKALDIQLGKVSKDYQSRGIIEETLVHEACHASLDPLFYNTKAWDTSRNLDSMYISEYAASHPNREDIAESFLPYLGVTYRKTRITELDHQNIQRVMKNRIRFFDQQEIDMFPWK